MMVSIDNLSSGSFFIISFDLLNPLFLWCSVCDCFLSVQIFEGIPVVS